MSRQFIQIRAEVITCGISLTLKPGDRLLVVDGHVVSIYTGTPVAPPFATTRTTNIEENATAKTKPTNKKRRSHRPYANTMELAGVLRQYLAATKGQVHTSQHLRDLVKLPADSEWGFMFRDAIKILANAGEVVRIGEGSRNMSYEYREVTGG